MKITKFRPVGRGGRRIGTFNVELDSVQLYRLTLTRNAQGEMRVFGDDITRLLDSIVQAVLAHAEAQEDAA